MKYKGVHRMKAYSIPKKMYDLVMYKVLKQPDDIIKETGIGTDYYNEWLSYRAVVLKHKNNPKKVYEWIKKHKYPVEKYKQRETTKHHWLIGKTKKRVGLLDKIADELNSMLEKTPSEFDIKRARTLTQRATVLTRGTDDLKYCKKYSERYFDYTPFTTA